MKCIRGYEDNQGNRMVGGSYSYFESGSKVMDVELDVELDGESYLVTCDLNFTCFEDADESVNCYSAGAYCDSVDVTSVEKYIGEETENRTYDNELVSQLTELVNKVDYREKLAKEYVDSAWDNVEYEYN